VLAFWPLCFGVSSQADKISDVFKTVHEFGLITLKNTSEATKQYDLRKLLISAQSSDGKYLHFLPQISSVEILVPITPYANSFKVCVTVTHPTDDKPMTADEQCTDVTLQSVAKHNQDDMITRTGVATLPIVAPKAKRQNDENKATEQTNPIIR
jgi:hypothetical protein